jgi:hypothetical protein
MLRAGGTVLRKLPAVAALTLAASLARAEAPIVSYDVDLKSFKRGVAAGDILAFDLYDSSDCTGSFLSTTNFEVGGDGLRVEEVKPLALKGQQPKPKKLARLFPQLALPTAGFPLFLLVSGDDGPLAGCQALGPTPARLPSPLWISAYEFDGISSSGSWFHSSAGDVASTGGSRECLHAPIRLPQGAVLTHFDAYVRDDDPGEDIDVSLYRNPLEDSPRTELAPARSVDQPERQIVTGNVTVGPLITNDQFHYYVEFCFDGGGVGFGAHGVWAVAVHFQ